MSVQLYMLPPHPEYDRELLYNLCFRLPNNESIYMLNSPVLHMLQELLTAIVNNRVRKHNSKLFRNENMFRLMYMNGCLPMNVRMQD